jgi:predicted dehydrogenase
MKCVKRQTRREFLDLVRRGTAATVLSMVGSRATKAFALANDRIAVAVIGCGGMGNHHLDGLLARKDVDVVAVCDVYAPRVAAAIKKTKDRAQGYKDYRHVLDRPDVDAIFVAAPDHWHTLMAIHGCQAGKDVYVEKPLSTTVAEGRAIVNAARRYDRVVQVGTQQRSLRHFQKAVELVQSGLLGTVTTTRAWLGPNGVMEYEKPGRVPEGLDWDMWLGPAPWVPYSPQRFYGFRAFHDYAGGELTNWGPHLVDIVHWGMGQERPVTVQAVGGSFRKLSGSDDYETLEVLYEFDGFILTWQQAHGLEYADKGYGTMFMGTAGKLIIDRNSYVVLPESKGIPETKPDEYQWIDVGAHHDNFFECMRTRKRPNSDIEIGHRATTTCLLGNIALAVRRKLMWDGETERFVGDEQANRHLFRPYRAPWHL